MAKLFKTYKTFKIKETTKKDWAENEACVKYWIFTKDDNYNVEMECETLQMCYDFIDSYDAF